jgi:MATE family multidrug resistance protein
MSITHSTTYHGVLVRHRLAEWWQGPGGLRQVLILALPLLVSTASWSVMYFIDRLYLLWYSKEGLAAALPAGMLAFDVMCLPLGICGYVTTFVSQYYGAKRFERIGPVVWQGVFLGVAAIPLVLATNPLAPWMFAQADHPPKVTELEVEYFQICNYGAGGMMIAAALSSFFTGRSDVRTVMIVDSLACLINVVLDYAWIFGKWGFESYGVAGAAWATVVAMWCRAVIYMYLWLRPKYREEFQTLRGFQIDWPLSLRLLRFAFPSGVQLFIEVTAFTLFLLLVGRLGTDPMTATNLALNVNSLAFMPVVGFGMATTTLVGQRLGEDRPDLAERSTWSAYFLASCCMLAMSALYLLAPEALLTFHETDADPVKFAELRDLTVILLRFVAVYCLFDAMNIVFSAAIKGAGDMRFVLITTLVTSFIPVLLTYGGLEFWGLGVYWCWIVITGWVWVLGVVYWLRFMQGKWKTMRVIESPIEDELLQKTVVDH